MKSHLRANIWLLVLTLVICCGVYPVALWAVGRVAFPHQAEGSLIRDADGKIAGSSLLASEFKGDEWFQPRPSAVGYNGAASGGSNWGANNYLLRDRVCRILGPIVKYASGPKKGQLAADDIVAWFREDKRAEGELGIVGQWAKDHGGLAQAWVKSDDAAKDFVKEWFAKRPSDFEAWKKENPTVADPSPEDLAAAFFVSFSKERQGSWLAINESKTKKNEKGEPEKVVEIIDRKSEDTGDIVSVFFDAWRTAHPDIALVQVPADMVMASGSGLDPHITLDNARYQLDRVAGKWAATTNRDASEIRKEIEEVLQRHVTRPLGGLAGVPLVNVNDANRALIEKFRTRK